MNEFDPQNRRFHAQPQQSDARGAQVVLAIACAAQFMVVLDISVVNVALPSIQAALALDRTVLQWVVNAYALAFAGFLLLGGRLADIYGRKRVFIFGLGLFTASSLIGGLAAGPATLIVARAIQGIGAAVLAPATLTVVTTTFAQGPQRSRALAIWTGVGLAGGTAGNVLGGALIQFLSWRAILLINVPIGAVCVLLAARFLIGERSGRDTHALDVPGAALATGGLFALTYGIGQLDRIGYGDHTTLGVLAFAVASLVAFVAVEARLATSPLIPLRLFRLRAVSAGNLVMIVAGACFMPMWYFLSLYMQNVLGYSPLQTGLGFLPHTLVTMMVGIVAAPRLMQKVDSRLLILLAALIAAAGFGWQSCVSAHSTYLTGILGPGIVISTGAGLLNTPATSIVTSGIAKADAGAASGLMNTSKQVGGALGLAALVAVADGHADASAALVVPYSRAFLTIAALSGAVALASFMLPPGRVE